MWASDSLASHPFPKLAMDNLKPLLEAASRELKEKKKLRNEEPAALYPHQWYDNDVFQSTAPLLQAFDNLELSCKFIRVFPSRQAFEKKRISQHAWIEYHYSHYVITLVSVFDICLVLTNSVFRLGNRDRDCKSDIIMKNDWVAQTPVVKALKKIYKEIRPHKENRNLHVHQGRIPKIARVMKSDTLDQLDMFSLVKMLGQPVVDGWLLKRAYAGQTKEICSRLDAETKTIKEAVWSFFDALQPTYIKHSTALHAEHRKLVDEAIKELERRKNERQ